MITVTDSAKERAIHLIAEENRPGDTFIRVGVDSGGCSGLSYKLEFDNQLQPTDQVFEDKGIKIVVTAKAFFISPVLSSIIQVVSTAKALCSITRMHHALAAAAKVFRCNAANRIPYTG
jgi:iron-sulfur cluster assembly accessory protein